MHIFAEPVTYSFILKVCMRGFDIDINTIVNSYSLVSVLSSFL